MTENIEVRVYYPRIGEKTKVDVPVTRKTKFFDYESRCWVDQTVTCTLTLGSAGWLVKTNVINALVPSDVEVPKHVESRRRDIKKNYTFLRSVNMKRQE